jgi:hypothetical protein
VCNAGDWSDKGTWYGQPTTAPVHSSYDTNCSGKADLQLPVEFLGPLEAGKLDASCNTSMATLCTDCLQRWAAAGNTQFFGYVIICNQTAYLASNYTASPELIVSPGLGQEDIPACGANQEVVQCNIKNSGVCLAASASSYTQSCE